MKIEELISSITESLTDRFQIEKATDFSSMLLELAENKHLQKSIMRIQRIPKNNELQLATWKTLLIVELRNMEELKDALEWTALVKDTLLDPDTADLYLFISSEKDEISLEQSLRIESTEQFCRKYVQRPDETFERLIERTFLQKIEDSSKKTIDIDPLYNALSLTSSSFKWFTKEEQKKWKNVFLSAYIGSDLVEKLITENEK